MQKCTRCKLTLNFSEFYKNSSKKSGISTECKRCNYLIVKSWRALHPENHRESSRIWYAKNREKKRAYFLKYYWANREKLLIKGKLWKLRNPEKNKEHDKKIKDKIKYLKKLNIPTGAVKVECPFCGIIGSVYFYKNIYRCFECIRDDNENRIKNIVTPPKIIKPQYISELPRKFVSVLNRKPMSKCKRCGRMSTDIQIGWCPDCRIAVTIKKRAIVGMWAY